MLLIEAEAAQRGWIQADPAQLYAAGVKASFEQWGAEGVDEYLVQEAVAYTGTDADKINKLLFSAGSVASWLMVLRHGLTGVVLIFRN